MEQEIFAKFQNYDTSQKYISRYYSDYLWERSVDEDIRKEFLQEYAKEHPLETMVIMDIYEKERAYEWIKEFFRDKEMFDACATIIQWKHDATITVVQFLLLIMKYLEGQELDEFAYVVFSDEKRMEQKKHLSSQRMSQIYAKKLKLAFCALPGECYAKGFYVKIMPAIIKARNEATDLADQLERYIQKEKYDSRDRNITGIENLYAYYETLLRTKSYNAVAIFLKRTWGHEEGDRWVKDADIFGWDEAESKQRLFTCTHPKVLFFGYWYIKEDNPEYNEEMWYQDIKRLNKDENICRWMDLYMFYQRMEKCVLEGDFDALMEVAKEAQTLQMFDLEKSAYMTKMMSRMSGILTSLLLNDRDAVAFLTLLDKINVYDYSYIDYTKTYTVYEKIDNLDTEEGRRKTEEIRALYDKLKNKLFRIDNVEKMVYLYMNSHLRMRVDLRDVVEHIASRVDDSSAVLKGLFASYPMHGIISYVSKKDNIKNRIFFDLSCPYTEWNFPNAEKERILSGDNNAPETQEAYNKIPRSDGGWVSDNLHIAELLKRNDKCTFYLSRYDAGYIYVSDITKEDFSKDEERRNKFPEHVREWLATIRKEGRMCEWNQPSPIYRMSNVESSEGRDAVALEILDTIFALKENEDGLTAFLMAMYNQYPTENINEFRYIISQRVQDYNVSEIKGRAIELGKQIFADKTLSSNLKLRIYQNTCLRKIYLMEYASRNCGTGFFSKNNILPLKVKKICPETGEVQFTTQYRKSVVSTFYSIVYRGEKCASLAARKETIYPVYIKSVDHKKKVFYVEDVFLNTSEIDPWGTFIHNMYDFKRGLTKEWLETIEENIKKLHVDYSDERKIKSYTHELYLVFKKYRFGKKECRAVLKTLGEYNYYAKAKEELIDFEFTQEEIDTYRNAYETFCQNNEQIGVDMLCYIYYRSFFRMVVSEEEFYARLSAEGKSVENIRMKCVKEGYC